MKQRILAAAAADISVRGLKFTVGDVAARLGISKKTLYIHYASKQALISGIIDSIVADMEDQRRLILAKNSPLEETLSQILTITPRNFIEMRECIMEDIYRYHPDEWKKIVSFHERQQSTILNLLETGKQTGAVRPVDTQLAAAALLGTAEKLMDPKFRREHNLTITAALQAITDFFLHGVLIFQTEEQLT